MSTTSKHRQVALKLVDLFCFIGKDLSNQAKLEGTIRILTEDFPDDELARIAVLEKALQKAATTFRHYGDLHWAKGTDEGKTKSCANHDLARECEAALAGQPFNT